MHIAKLLPSNILSSQARKPTGLIGCYIMTKLFNHGNADINAFVKETLEVQGNDSILEIGFGPGKLINAIAEITADGIVEGIDFSAVMLSQAQKINKHHILNGRVRLQKKECRQLPFKTDLFDKVCSTNTLYFWKTPEEYFAEMLRVLKPNGKVVIGFRDDKQMKGLNLSKDIFSTYSCGEVAGLLSNAGFTDVKILEKEGKPFLSYCAIGNKPQR